MSVLNRRLVLAERPTGHVEAQTVRLEQVDVPEPGSGEALVHNRYLSIDPTIRTWMDDAPGLSASDRDRRGRREAPASGRLWAPKRPLHRSVTSCSG